MTQHPFEVQVQVEMVIRLTLKFTTLNKERLAKTLLKYSCFFVFMALTKVLVYPLQDVCFVLWTWVSHLDQSFESSINESNGINEVLAAGVMPPPTNAL